MNSLLTDMSPEMVTITDTVFVVAYTTLIALKALFAARCLTDTQIGFKLIASQQKRYSLVAAALVVGIGPYVYLIARFGSKSVLEGIDFWMQSSSIMGKLYGVMGYTALAIPVIAILTLFSVYRNPAPIGRRVRGGYVMTSEVRLKDYGFVPKVYARDFASIASQALSYREMAQSMGLAVHTSDGRFYRLGKSGKQDSVSY